jgi:tetratricopeptide (TPR) repeat protein
VAARYTERFEVQALAGVGAMGRVFRARDKTTGERVALKVIVRVRDEDKSRLAREADALSRVCHPHVVRYVAHDLDGEEPYLAMEWLDGAPLDDALKAAALSVDASTALASRVAEALVAAHALGITHRDVKPSNLFLVGRDPRNVKLLDFGIALNLRESRLTQTGVAMGTPRYMAPEQARGQRAVGAPADVFGLGGVLFHCVAGRPAFDGEGALEILLRIVTEDAPRLTAFAPHAPPELEALVAHMLEKSPEARPDLAAVIERLAAIRAAHADGADPPPSVARPGAFSRENAVRCLVVARPTTDAELDVEALRGALGAGGAVIDVLADGSVLACVPASAAASDQAAAAARAALALSSALAGARIAVVAARRATDGGASPRIVLPTSDAEGGAVVDDTIAQLIADRFEVARTSTGALKLVGASHAALATPRTLLGKRAPFVGRKGELVALEAAYAACVNEGTARAVIVRGGAGVGKSRVRSVVLERLAVRDDPPAVWIARGDAMRAGSPFGMLAELLEGAARGAPGGAADEASLAARRDRLAAFVAARAPADDASRCAEFLADLAGLRADEPSAMVRAARRDPQLYWDQTFRAFRAVVAAQARRGPLVVVLEDLHWGDAPTVRFVDGALASLASSPLLVLALARPEITTSFPQLFAGRPTTELHLGELDARASAELVEKALGAGVDPGLTAEILARADGNAFFLEELVRAVSAGRRELPNTVLAVAQARLDALDERQRRVLRVASVIGATFWRGGVIELLGSRAGIDVDATLDALVRAELVAPRPVARFADERELAFRSAVTRDAAYATLTDEDRALGHRLAAGWLERSGERDARVLRGHLERAGLLARAAVCGLRAVEHALEANDFDGAVAEVEHVLPFAPNDALKGALLERAAEAHTWRGDAKRSERAGLDALALLTRGSADWFDACAQVLRGSSRLGHRDVFLDVARDLLGERADRAPAAYVHATSMAIGALVPWGMDDVAEALFRSLEGPARALAHDASARRDLAYANFWRAHARGDAEGAHGHLRELMRLGEDVGDLRAVVHHSINCGSVLTQVGQIAAAKRVLGDALASATAMGVENSRLLCLHNYGLALAFAGESDAALRAEREAVASYAARGETGLEAASLGYLARALLLAGDPEGARDAATRALALPQREKTRGMRLGALALAELELGRTGDALAHAEEAYERVANIGASLESVALAEVAFVATLLAKGDRARAATIARAGRARLEATAARFVEPGWSHAYLHGMPDHAALLSLAASLERA